VTYLLYEIDITITWGNTFLCGFICHSDEARC